MMNIWHDISPKRIRKDRFYAVIEIQKGGKNKYELDKETGMLKLDRVLFVLVLCSEQIQPMTIVECAPIGVLMMEDGGAKDEKIIAVPVNDPNYNCYTNIDQLPAHYFEEIKHFFEVYKTLEVSKSTSVLEVDDRAKAEEIIQSCMDEYIRKFQM